MLWRAEKVLNWTCGDSYQNYRVVQGMNSILGVLLLSKAISLLNKIKISISKRMELEGTNGIEGRL